MKFIIERWALVKMLHFVGKPDPASIAAESQVRLYACAARVFVEANNSTAGVEALVLQEGSCHVDHKILLRTLKAYPGRKNITVEVDERSLKFGTSTRPISNYTATAEPPGDFTLLPVSSDWLDFGRATRRLPSLTGPIKLPNADKAIVEQTKILDYLLNIDHRIGGGKARFFQEFGFTQDRWQEFAEALREHAQSNEVKDVTQTEYGPRYEIEGRLRTPDGRRPIVTTIWQVDEGTIEPRLITAYPVNGR